MVPHKALIEYYLIPVDARSASSFMMMSFLFAREMKKKTRTFYKNVNDTARNPVANRNFFYK